FSVVVGSGVRIDLAQAGDVTHQFLEHRPKPARLVELLVIETHRQEGAKPVENPQQIEIDSRPGVLALHRLSLSRGLHTRTDIRPAIAFHQASGAIAGNAQQSARPMVLEAATESTDAGRIEGGRNRLAHNGWNRLAVEREGNLAGGAEQATRDGRAGK